MTPYPCQRRGGNPRPISVHPVGRMSGCKGGWKKCVLVKQSLPASNLARWGSGTGWKVGMGGVVGRTGMLTGISGAGRQHVFEPSILYALHM